MATLLELADFSASADYAVLIKKIRVAIAKKAVAVGNLATPTAEQVAWAKSAITGPDQYAATVLNYLVAANASLTIVQIVSVSDASIETGVGTAVDKILSL